MKKSFLSYGFAAATAMVLTASTPDADAGTSSTASLTATATVVTSISLTCGTALAFGQVVSEALADDVTITAAGVRSGAGYIASSTFSRGVCSVTGNGTATFTITLPASITLTDGASHNLTVDTLTSSPSGTGSLTAGSATINIGGTLHVNPSNVASFVTATQYSGTGNVTVAYN